MDQGMVYLGVVLWALEKNGYSAIVGGKCSTNVDCILMVDGVVELFCILSDVPCSCTINC